MEGVKASIYKYLTMSQAVLAVLLIMMNNYGLPENYEEAAVYVSMVILAALVYRKDKDTKTILEQLNLTPQQEYTIKQTIEFFLQLLGYQATIEKAVTEESTSEEPDIKAMIEAELERRGVRIGKSNSGRSG